MRTKLSGKLKKGVEEYLLGVVGNIPHISNLKSPDLGGKGRRSKAFSGSRDREIDRERERGVWHDKARGMTGVPHRRPASAVLAQIGGQRGTPVAPLHVA